MLSFSGFFCVCETSRFQIYFNIWVGELEMFDGSIESPVNLAFISGLRFLMHKYFHICDSPLKKQKRRTKKWWSEDLKRALKDEKKLKWDRNQSTALLFKFHADIAFFDLVWMDRCLTISIQIDKLHWFQPTKKS